MSDRAYIYQGEIKRFFTGDKGSVMDGQRRLCSPVIIGWESDGHKVVAATETLIDNSTGDDTITESTAWAYREAEDDVHRTVTTRDRTAQEIDDQNTAIAASEADLILGEISRRALNMLYTLAKVNTPSLTMAQFVNAFEGSQGNEPITRQGFINYIKDNRL